MVESIFQSFISDVTSDRVIMPRTVTLDTPIPTLTPSDKLVPPPDYREFEETLARINHSIRKLRAQLVLLHIIF